MTSNDLPLDESVRMLRYHSVTRGEQAIISIQGSDDIVVIVNPADGRNPYILFQDSKVEMRRSDGAQKAQNLGEAETRLAD